MRSGAVAARATASALLLSLLLPLLLSIPAPLLAGEIAPADKRSGYSFMRRETQAMQDDDTANPGTFSVLDGEALWKQKAGSAGRSCGDCHGDASASMKGLAARYPVFDPDRGRPITIEQRVNQCRSERQGAPVWAWESKELLGMAAFVGRQSRGIPITTGEDARLRRFSESGRAMFERRQGQLNLSCAQCHDDNWGKLLAGNVVPQGHPTGYPLYRLEWQNMGSLQRRLRNCLVGMRAEPYDLGSPEFVELELYLMERARGLLIETPAVRP